MAASISYVASPQANIYFDGILIDECYDIQYSYRESKEPIYGYLSQHFDAILTGTVIITGALTINYKHDQYLVAVLDKASNPEGKIADNVNSRPSSLKNFQYDYNKSLADYAQAMKDQAALKQTLTSLNKQMAQVQANILDAQKQHEVSITNAKDSVEQDHVALDDFEASLSPEALHDLTNDYQDYVNHSADLTPATPGFFKSLLDSLSSWWNNNSNLQQYIELNQNLEDDQDELQGIQTTPVTKIDTSALQAKIDKTAAALKAINLEKMRDNTSRIQNKINNLTVTSQELLDSLPITNPSADLNSTRAEDYGDGDFGNRQGFTIEFNYNGSPHKRILNCQLLGHAHVITQSGMPVKEQYTFIGQRLE